MSVKIHTCAKHVFKVEGSNYEHNHAIQYESAIEECPLCLAEAKLAEAGDIRPVDEQVEELKQSLTVVTTTLESTQASMVEKEGEVEELKQSLSDIVIVKEAENDVLKETIKELEALIAEYSSISPDEEVEGVQEGSESSQ